MNRKFLARLFLIYILVRLPVLMSAQTMLDPIVNQKRFMTEIIDSDMGLSSPLIQCIYKDRYGFLWIGSQYGLDRYDGYTVTNMSELDFEGKPASMEWIWSIEEDLEGKLWVCSSRGLFRYDRTSDAFDMILPNPEDPVSMDNQVYSVKQDSRGIHWVFTRGGLFSYNEAENLFKDYKKDSIIGRELLRSWNFLMWFNKSRFLEDMSGTIWICTTNGLKKYDSKEDQFITFRHDQDDTQSISGDNIGSAIEDKFGNLWFTAGSQGTDEIKLNRLIDADKGVFQKYAHDPLDSKSLVSDWSFSMYCSRDSNLWIGGRNGFSKFNYETDDFDSYKLPGGRDFVGAVANITEDFDGNLWMIRNSWGLTSFNPVSKISYHYWCDFTNPNNLLPDQSLYDILLDPDGTVWLAGPMGITRSTPFSKQFYSIMSDTLELEPYQDKMVSSVCSDSQGTLWFGGEFGLYKSPDFRPGEKNELIRVNDRWAYSLFGDSKGQLWIGSNGAGLGVLNKRNNNIKWYRRDQNNPDSLAENYITMLQEDSRGLFWVLPFEQGLNIFDSRQDKFISIKYDKDDPEGLLSKSYWSVIEDRFGNMWFGSLNEGMDMLELTDGLADSIRMVFAGELDRDQLHLSFRHFKSNHQDPGSLSSNQVMDFYKDSSERLWIATSNGLNLYNEENDNFYVYTVSHGLPDNVILGILEDDDGNLWLSSRKGICKIVLEDGIGPDLIKSVNSYRYFDGLQGDVFWENTCCKSINGWMCFGGSNGLTVFHPDSIKDNYIIPPVFLTDIFINDHSIHSPEYDILETSIFETEKITLPYKQNTLGFEYLALNYSNAEQNGYRYIMEGLDDDWVEAGSRRYAEYRDLKPGQYTFRVLGSNDDGVWNHDGASLRIIINYPWYKTKLSYLLYLVILIAGIYKYNQYRTGRFQKEKNQLDGMVRERTSIIQDQKDRIQETNNLLNEQKEELEQQTDELTQQKEELQLTLDRLKQTQDQLIQSEKMSALGGLVAGVAHEINTPVGISVTAASSLVEETKAMAEKYKENKISKADFKEYLSSAHQSSKLILANMERTAEMIQSFKMVSADQSTGEKRRVVLRSYMEDIIRSLYPKLKGRRISINLDVNPNLEADSYPGAVSQIFTNLIINSLTHGFTGDEKGEILIHSAIEDGILLINFQDNGRGIAKDNLPKIFDPFFTTNKKDGTGLGLNIVYNLVTQKLNGSIQCNSTLGDGVEFKIEIPLD